MQNFTRAEKDLWEAADQLRANSDLASNEYFMPLLGVIFLRHASNRFDAVTIEIADDQASGRVPKRKAIKADYVRRRALWLPKKARYDSIMALPTGSDWGQALIDAMNAIEADFEPLAGVLPKDYTRFDNDFLEDLLRIFNSETLRKASGDVFGRIYEYFLMKFADQKAHDDGEFFTPPSIVQTIVNVIEPEHGSVFDPACGSGGMFVQSSHFIEDHGLDTAKRVVFYGQEKTATTIRLAKMNLAVHGLEGDIREANTYYQDEHTLVGKCDFVMANPPFNVDMVDSEKAKSDNRRLPFGLPGITKNKKTKKKTVSNGNYLWISYFWSYLNEKGRGGFVMSSQASSAGHGEKEVRRKIVETGDVDVMIAIRGNFFYTRSVPCELWFFDRDKPERRQDEVLMLDARNVHRKVTRKIFDFSPEQLANLTAIVWLYRDETERYLGLIRDYFDATCREAALVPEAVTPFDEKTEAVLEHLESFSKASKKIDGLDAATVTALADGIAELRDTIGAYEKDRDTLLKALDGFRKKTSKKLPEKNAAQHKSREAYEPIAEELRGLVKQADLIYKIAARARDGAHAVVDGADESAAEIATEKLDRRGLTRLIKDLDEQRKTLVEQLKLAGYFHKQIVWLQDRFPDAKIVDVPGLVKVVSRAEIEEADWSLTPGRFVGVAPPEEDENFDLEEAMRDIHIELKGLNEEAIELAAKIQTNFEELGV
jgi:type I restriction enzyme M protein